MTITKIVFNLRRHSDRKDSTKTGLSRIGVNLARKFGARLNLKNTKLYFGTVQRNKSTARFILQKAKGVALVPRMRRELTTSSLKKKECDAIVKQYGGKEKATRVWLNGNVPASVVLPPRIAADRIIRKKLKIAYKLARAKKKRITIEGISHQENQQAVMERLLGFSSEKILGKKQIKPLERIKFSFDNNQGLVSVIMKFRGKEYDVTQRFNKIIALKEEVCCPDLMSSLDFSWLYWFIRFSSKSIVTPHFCLKCLHWCYQCNVCV